MLITVIFAPSYVNRDVEEKKFPKEIWGVPINGGNHILIRGNSQKLMNICEGDQAKKQFIELANTSYPDDIQIFMFVGRLDDGGELEDECNSIIEMWDGDGVVNKINEFRVHISDVPDNKLARSAIEKLGELAERTISMFDEMRGDDSDWALDIRGVINNLIEERGDENPEIRQQDKKALLESLNKYAAWMILADVGNTETQRKEARDEAERSLVSLEGSLNSLPKNVCKNLKEPSLSHTLSLKYALQNARKVMSKLLSNQTS